MWGKSARTTRMDVSTLPIAYVDLMMAFKWSNLQRFLASFGAWKKALESGNKEMHVDGEGVTLVTKALGGLVKRGTALKVEVA